MNGVFNNVLAKKVQRKTQTKAFSLKVSMHCAERVHFIRLFLKTNLIGEGIYIFLIKIEATHKINK